MGGRDAVVRVGAHGEDYLKDAAAAELFSSSAVPVPRILAYGEVEGLCYAVSERVRGTPLDELDAEQLDQALPSLLRVIEDIGACDITRTTGFGDWSPHGRGGQASWGQALLAVGDDRPRLPGWRDALATCARGMTAFEHGLERLAALTPRLPSVRELIHRDLLGGNVLVRDGAVAGVLDWGCSLYGDSLYDAAWLIYSWPSYPQWSALDIRSRIRTHLAAAGRLPADFEERIHAYEIHIALGAIQYWAFARRWAEVERHARAAMRLSAG